MQPKVHKFTIATTFIRIQITNNFPSASVKQSEPWYIIKGK